MPKDLKLSQIGSSQLPPPFRRLHSPGVKKTLSNYLCLLFLEIVYTINRNVKKQYSVVFMSDHHNQPFITTDFV